MRSAGFACNCFSISLLEEVNKEDLFITSLVLKHTTMRISKDGSLQNNEKEIFHEVAHVSKEISRLKLPLIGTI